jgi:hypothetical protein
MADHGKGRNAKERTAPQENARTVQKGYDAAQEPERQADGDPRPIDAAEPTVEPAAKPTAKPADDQ